MSACLDGNGLKRVWELIKEKFVTLDKVHEIEEKVKNYKTYPAGGNTATVLGYKNANELRWVTPWCVPDIEDGKVVLQQQFFNTNDELVGRAGTSIFPVVGFNSPGVLKGEDYTEFKETTTKVHNLEEDLSFPEDGAQGDILMRDVYTNKWGVLRPYFTPGYSNLHMALQTLVKENGEYTALSSLGSVEIPVASAQQSGILTAQDYAKLQKAASKSDLVGVYRYKGSVDQESEFPLEPEHGDVYNVTSNGKNYAWNANDGVWDSLGGSFALDPLTDDEIDAICAE